MSQFDQGVSTTAGALDPPWRSTIRSAAFEAFSGGSMPSQDDEIWRYIDLDFTMDGYDSAASNGVEIGDDPLVECFSNPIVARVVNGEYVGDDHIADDFFVMSLRRAAAERSDMVEAAFNRSGISADTDIFKAAAAAFGGDGVFVHASRNVVVPSVVAIDVHAGSNGSASFPDIVISTDEHADISVVVHLRSQADADALIVPQFSIDVGDGSRISLTVVQHLGYGVRSIGSLRAEIGADAMFRFGEVGLGGRLARLHLDVGLVGRGSSANVVGAYFGEENQILDYRYFMRHVGTNTRSDMYLKGAVEDDARSVFTGMIRIEETGQKTEAYQTNRNLILSDGASAQSVPNLEILANDVKCGHGSTVGPLDVEQRYYLMSRGLGPDRADRLQIRGFFEEALQKLPHPELATSVRSWINRKYETAQAEGRV
ncbi:MAG: Fe-S cluster assembly protein SufD [Actinomycetota bacterium]|nr:Fe-S cluster assembly protein SufD [Actinomycetota bacterium]